MDFTPIETAVMNRIQKDFPLVSDPLSALAEELSIPMDQFLATVKDLKKRGVVRNIAGIFNADRLGFVTTLVALRVDEKDLPMAAEVINGHPGVSHNYQRDHHYNIWFTLAAESEASLDRTVQVLASQSGAKDHIILRNEKLLKIGLLLSIGDEIQPGHGTAGAKSDERSNATIALSDDDKESIRLLQKDLPIAKDPFAILINDSNSPITQESFMACFQRLKRDGILRRYAAVLRHREAGYRSNAMTVWKPGDGSDIERIVKIFHDSHLISHLYLRTLYPGKWEYPLFAMIHARSDDQLRNMIEELSEKSGIDDYQVLYSLKEFKKERVVYFSPRFKEWERQAGL
ncbi:MAG: Lrp/AsnC family transcriptional regulator [Spirochaetes bacterium]|nr:Lrp/AsnC family transcriptional regulator [Spirochaetota bacterium]